MLGMGNSHKWTSFLYLFAFK